ncbi:MAG: hypothetical protein PHU47_01230 [Candidatus ainarchaeum sp.]|nr:hypothetical protein [Candidatus ainarchaeum sp.]
MARNKDRKKKEFLIAQRDKVGPGYLNTPVWIIQKAGKRIWNKRQKRNWKQTEFGQEYLKLERKEQDQKKIGSKTSGKRVKTARFKATPKVRNTTIIKKK